MREVKEEAVMAVVMDGSGGSFWQSGRMAMSEGAPGSMEDEAWGDHAACQTADADADADAVQMQLGGKEKERRVASARERSR